MAGIAPPKKLHWTAHAQGKMRYYGLSEGRVRRILHTPLRVEEGIAPETVAYMQRSTGKHPYELWVMVQDVESTRKVISAWRYPGVTEERNPLPSSVRHALEELVSEAVE